MEVASLKKAERRMVDIEVASLMENDFVTKAACLMDGEWLLRCAVS